MTELAKLSNHDKKTYEKLLELIPQESISSAAQFNYEGFAFSDDTVAWVWEFDHFCRSNPSFVFADKELEAYRQELVAAVSDFIHALAYGPLNHRALPKTHIVPPEWEFTQKERFHDVVDALQTNAQKCYSAYEKLVRSACIRPD